MGVHPVGRENPSRLYLNGTLRPISIALRDSPRDCDSAGRDFVASRGQGSCSPRQSRVPESPASLGALVRRWSDRVCQRGIHQPLVLELFRRFRVRRHQGGGQPSSCIEHDAILSSGARNVSGFSGDAGELRGKLAPIVTSWRASCQIIAAGGVNRLF